eukprot:scaffold7506_cov286-Pinguiococcus_pyrenoidosus.AAC.4
MRAKVKDTKFVKGWSQSGRRLQGDDWEGEELHLTKRPPAGKANYGSMDAQAPEHVRYTTPFRPSGDDFGQSKETSNSRRGQDMDVGSCRSSGELNPPTVIPAKLVNKSQEED